MKNNKTKRIIIHVLVGLVYLLAAIIIFLSDWGHDVFNVGIEEIIFTLSNSMGGLIQML